MPAGSEYDVIMFENNELSPDELPSVDAVNWLGIDPKFVNRERVKAAIVTVILAAGIGMLHAILAFAFSQEGIELSLWWLWLIVLAVVLPLFAWPSISIRRKGYALRERDIVYKSGVVWHTVTAVPFNRIQHVEKSSTPLDRRYGLASLQLFTAGGSGGDLKIDGLQARTAEKLRVFILSEIGSSIEQV
jgi:membrane protein YdbS with pleckstrin-like domain